MTLTNPSVFTRTLTTPAALPWDQRRIAQLDAEAGSPSPLHLVYILVLRLTPWRPGGPSDFLIAYARRSDTSWTLSASTVVQGRTRHLRFETPAARQDRLQKWTIALGCTFAAMAIIAGAGVWSVMQRASGDAYLTGLEKRARAQARQRRMILDVDRNTDIIAEAGLSRSTLAATGADLNKIAQLRDPTIRITAIEWIPGTVVLETPGPSAPLQGGELTDERSSSGGHRWTLRRNDLQTSASKR